MLLEVKNLKVSVDGTTILNGLNLSVGEGEVHVLMGPNGAGKSTLVNTIMGHPQYKVEEGSIVFDGKDITHAPANERAKAGLFLSFQNPEEVPGVTLESFMRTSRLALTGKPVKLFAYKKELAEKMQMLNMDAEYASRYLNVGFSGGEKKKSEILQMLMSNPKLAILDETDSGLDVDAVRTVSQGVENYMNDGQHSLLIITHNTKILEALTVDYVHILMDGRIVRTGDSSLVDEINRNGFQQISAAAV
ncbi:MAG: Fe-S cluster assembly ATPase SufC [Thermocaproicibacter melissae]|jgi:Fe-S cluster assembly ATP-binding protein|uniref:Fe-S cluster assembly ATPase SufC n=1 Tax=Thermocaproicibacter melissae TaxID=2966552 RepID=UPI0024B2086D|nr:Fe-S cluster assembly ATPase SufC [Thermocaproicibacter melissae]WBY64090.1 Fe-S cluster assembly ATPase SufC [Thermocaproicibacter melissae]